MKKLLITMLSIGLMIGLTGCQKPHTEIPSITPISSSASVESSSDPIESNPENPSSQSPSSSSEVSVPKMETVDKIKAGKATNKNVIGYIKIPNTPAEGLVLQHPTDIFHYERKDITESYNLYGCYFLDPLNPMGTRAALSSNTTIYAHNMSDNPDTTSAQDKMFSQLLRWNDKDWAQKNPYIYFSTEEDDMVWEVFAGFYTTTFFESTKYNYNQDNPTKEQMDVIIAEAKSRSTLNYDVTVTRDDKILTLSTCTYKYGGQKNLEQRYVVQAKLVSSKNLKDATIVTINQSPKQPQFSKIY